MKILYLGPYRSQLLVSHASNNIIRSIAASIPNIDLTLRPIYDEVISSSPVDNDILSLETKEIDPPYNLIIQHCDINQLAHTTKNEHTTNIAIPLFRFIYNKQHIVKQLKHFDKILVDSDEAYDILKNHYGLDQVIKYRYSSGNINYTPISLSPKFKDSTKFCYISDSSNDTTQISKILKSFFANFRNSPNYCLVLGLNTTDHDTVVKEVDNIIGQIKTELKIFDNKPVVIPVIKSLSLSDIIATIYLSDIVLDISNNNDIGIIKYLCNILDKNMISSTRLLEYNSIPSIINNQYVSGETENDLTIESLSRAMSKSILVKSQTNNDATPTIDKILCQ